jgi:hypothetical protein
LSDLNELLALIANTIALLRHTEPYGGADRVVHGI